MSEILTANEFDQLTSDYADAAERCGKPGATHEDDRRKARLGGQLDMLYRAVLGDVSALRAENVALRAAAKDAVREWRLHGQLTDSCRPLERVLGIHASFCPTFQGNDCECDLSQRPLRLPSQDIAAGIAATEPADYDRCPRLPYCYECLEDVPDASHLRRETVGPHPITGQIVVRWVHREGCPQDIAAPIADDQGGKEKQK